MNWEEKLNETEKTLLWWYRKMGEMEHGDLTIYFKNGNKNKIDIQPAPTNGTNRQEEV